MLISRSHARTSALLLATVAASAIVNHVDAQGPRKFVLIRGSELAAAVNLPDKNLKLEGSLFVPASAARIRAVIVFLKHVEIEERS